MSAITDGIESTIGYADDRLSAAGFLKRNLKKVFPDHWSFMLGEIALYSFIVLLISGTYLTLFFKPAMTEVIYNGSYTILKGVKMSEAYASTLNISFDVRGGLLMRQIHHWAALFFIAAISVHMCRVFFTGAFRKPRELNWLVGTTLLITGILEGFAGYSLPDDLLSGTGLRIAEGIVQATPILGTYVSFLLFGGPFPGNDFISRLYTVHVLLVPGLILGLITVHLMMVWYQKHTQFPGPGRTEKNVVGYPFMPVYMAKAGGFFFVVFGVTTLISALVTINPVWMYGPYVPDQVTAGSQPDFYIGWLDGAVRIMPNWELTLWHHYTLSLNIIIPAMIIPGILFTGIALFPWIEAWVTGDKRPHNILDRPRNAPTRTALGVATIAFYGMLWISGGNDIIATTFSVPFNTITWVLRIAVFVVPPIAFFLTRRFCLALQRKDHDKLLHGRETGRILRHPDGEFTEIHAPISTKERAVIMAKQDVVPIALPPATDAEGVRNPAGIIVRSRARLSEFYYGPNIALPSETELAKAAAHLEHEAHAALPVLEREARLEIVGGGGVIRDPGPDGESTHS
jgi:ubiquinol-cytochrome c reductase cytochrome b subunit